MLPHLLHPRSGLELFTPKKRPSAKGPSELPLLEGNGHEFHIDARPRGSSAKISTAGPSDLPSLTSANGGNPVMSNPDRFVDHFKRCKTVDVGLGSKNEPALAGGAGGTVGRLRLPQ
jgi:hypothetical protein